MNEKDLATMMAIRLKPGRGPQLESGHGKWGCRQQQNESEFIKHKREAQ
jgi:hypothetical protein